jgi:hypothetical protein
MHRARGEANFRVLFPDTHFVDPSCIRSRSVAKSLHTSSWTELPLELLWVRKEEVAADLGSETPGRRAWTGRVGESGGESGGR